MTLHKITAKSELCMPRKSVQGLGLSASASANAQSQQLPWLMAQVDFINSVQFSNHTGYKQWKGTVMSGEQLWELVEGLEMNGLCRYTHLLTGDLANR